jgi:hypothetical protein
MTSVKSADRTDHQEDFMPGKHTTRDPHTARRVGVSALGIAGVGAAVALAAAIPATASASHQASAAHHVSDKHREAEKRHANEKHHNRHLVVRGIVAGHHHRTVTVFAKTAKVGAKTRHNERIEVHFAHSAHGRTKIPTGDHFRILATGTASRHVFTVRHNQHETITPAPAALFFGTVKAVNANLLTVSENDRDDGDHHDGNDNDGEHHGNGNDRVSPADHSPGGPGDNDNEGPGHSITVDDTTATITVDGASGTIAVGDTVAVLGEASHDTVVASTIYAFTTAPSFMRGKVQQVNGDTVTIRDDGNTSTVSLTGVPLAINGDVGATPSQLVVGDKLLLVGPVDAGTGRVTPEVAFAFNHHDDHPCGDNDEHHGNHGGDGGIDG